MSSPLSPFGAAILAAALTMVQAAQAPARAGGDIAPSLAASVEQTSTLAALRTNPDDRPEQVKAPEEAQLSAPSDVELVTGDGQQASAPGNPIACVAPAPECIQ